MALNRQFTDVVALSRTNDDSSAIFEVAKRAEIVHALEHDPHITNENKLIVVS